MTGRDWYQLLLLLMKESTFLCNTMSQMSIYMFVLDRTIPWKHFTECISYDNFTSGCWSSVRNRGTNISNSSFYRERGTLKKNNVVSFFSKNGKDFYYLNSDRIISGVLNNMILCGDYDSSYYNDLRELHQTVTKEMTVLGINMKLADVINTVPEKTVKRKEKESSKQRFDVPSIHRLLVDKCKDRGIDCLPMLCDWDKDKMFREIGGIKSLFSTIQKEDIVPFIEAVVTHWYDVVVYLKDRNVHLSPSRMDLIALCYYRAEIFNFLLREGYLNGRRKTAGISVDRFDSVLGERSPKLLSNTEQPSNFRLRHKLSKAN